MLRRHRCQCAHGARNDRPLDHCKLWLTLDTLLINYGTVLCCLFCSTMLYCSFLLMYLPASGWVCLCVCRSAVVDCCIQRVFVSSRCVLHVRICGGTYRVVLFMWDIRRRDVREQARSFLRARRLPFVTQWEMLRAKPILISIRNWRRGNVSASGNR